MTITETKFTCTYCDRSLTMDYLAGSDRDACQTCNEEIEWLTQEA